MKQTASMIIMTRALFSLILLKTLRTFGDNLIAMDSRARGKQTRCRRRYTLSCGLVHDDIFSIVENGDVRPGDTPLSNLLRNDFWGKPMSDPTSHKSYRPLTTLSFRLNYWLHELDPVGYHAVNMLLHYLCTVLFYWLARSVVLSNTINKESYSFMMSALFAVHPIHTEAVTGVVGRADVLSCLFFLLSFLCYYYSIHEKSSKLMFFIKLICCLIFGCCSMFSKEHGITVFGICILYELYSLLQSRTRFGSSLTISHSAIIRTLVLTIGTVLLIAFRLSMLSGMLPQFSSYDNPASFSDSLLTKLLTYSYLCYFNAQLLVYPSILSYDWQMGSIPLVESLGDIRNISTCVFILYLTGLASLPLRKFAKDSDVIFLGLILMVVPFVPASNLFIRVGFVVAERILYIPSLGYCVLVVHGLKILGNTISLRYHIKSIDKILFLVIIITYILRTVDRNPVWKTRESLFRSGVETLPHNSKAHYNYANYLKDTGQTDSAVHHYREAIKLTEDHSSAHNNMATLLNGPEALYHLNEAIRHNRRHFKAFFNLANEMWNLGNKEKAEELYKESIKINPNYTDALIKLSSLLVSLGRNDEAILFVSQSVKLKDNEPDVLHNSAAVLMMAGNVSWSISLWRKVLSLNPTHSEAMAGLARALRSLGENNEAEELFKRSLLIAPKASVYQSLAGLYYNTGRWRESHSLFKKALDMEPDNTDILCSYAQVSNSLEEKEVLERLILVHPDSFCLYINIAGIFVKQKLELHQALTYSLKATQIAATDKERYDAYNLHGTILKDTQNLSDSAKNFEKAAAIFPDAVGTWINLGAIMHLLGDYRKAEVFYRKAQSLDPQNTIVLGNLKKLQSLQAKKH
uniref:dolichyl-phosphate-mannose--protein mannosyltransferase n=1 Tax=Amphimedon queenslandica TaxID=400682 RepID=A0A1X7VL19_AMPQE